MPSIHCVFNKPLRSALILAALASCSRNPSTVEQPVKPFAAQPTSVMITPGTIDEASGIADSKINPGYLWVEQDGGNSNDIFLLSHSGTISKKINIKSVVNRDWEDIAIGNGPIAGTNYIYIAELGDNNQTRSDYIIHRFVEPNIGTDTVFSHDEIHFTYPDGSHDAEALLIDNQTKDLYVITKQDAVSKIYKVSYPQNISAANSATLVGSLPFNGVTSAAISPDGREVIVKTYAAIYYWKKSGNESIDELLKKTALTLDYQAEVQGEAISFKNDNSGFFTLSERPAIVPSVSLNFYSRTH